MALVEPHPSFLVCKTDADMATKQVSLQDVLSALGGPLEERALWALSCQALAALKKSIQGYYLHV